MLNFLGQPLLNMKTLKSQGHSAIVNIFYMLIRKTLAGALQNLGYINAIQTYIPLLSCIEGKLTNTCFFQVFSYVAVKIRNR